MCYFTDVRHPVDIALGLKSTNLSLVGEFGVLNGFLLTLKSINYFYFKTRHIFVLKTFLPVDIVVVVCAVAHQLPIYLGLTCCRLAATPSTS